MPSTNAGNFVWGRKDSRRSIFFFKPRSADSIIIPKFLKHSQAFDVLAVEFLNAAQYPGNLFLRQVLYLVFIKES